MTKYHNTPDGPRPCTASVRACPVGAASEHYTSRETAQQAYEKSLELVHAKVSTTSRKSVAESLKSETPVNIDNKLAELYYETSKIRGKLSSNEAQVTKLQGSLARHLERGGGTDHPNYRTSERSLTSLEKDNDALRERIVALKAESEPYDREFERRGGWSRAFLVSNGNGHVHKNMSCSTCFPTTEYSWMTDYSGKSEEQIVDAAGERACTVCYPSAPVSTLSKPTKMFTDEEKRLAVVREEREKKRQAKMEKEKAAGITAEDGSPLKVPSWGRDEVVKTERSAQTMAVDALVDRRRAEAARKSGQYINPEVSVEAEKRLEVLVPALSRKRSERDSVVLEDLMKRAAAKWRREYAEHFGPWED